MDIFETLEKAVGIYEKVDAITNKSTAPVLVENTVERTTQIPALFGVAETQEKDGKTTFQVSPLILALAGGLVLIVLISTLGGK